MATAKSNLKDPSEKGTVAEKTVESSTKLCVICKDNATGIHFGAITCEGCKGFFRRSTKKNASFKCSLLGNCTMTKESRKHCQACRLQACLKAGMRSDLVLSDEDVNKKRELIKANREKREKQRLEKNEQERLKEVATSANVKEEIRMTMEEKLLLENLLKSHNLSYDFKYEEYDTFRGKERISSPRKDESSKENLAFLVASMSKDGDESPFDESSCSTDVNEPQNAKPENPTQNLENMPQEQNDNLDIFSSLHGISEEPQEPIDSNETTADVAQSNEELDHACSSSLVSESANEQNTNPLFDDPLLADDDNDDSLGYLRDLLKSHGMSLSLVEDSNSKHLLQHFCDIMTWGIKKVIEFCKHIPQFHSLSLVDQIVLLRGGCLEMLVLRSYFAFSSHENKYMSEKFQYMPSDFLQAGASKEFVEKYNNLHVRMRKMKLQVEEICLLLALVLFSPDRPGLSRCDEVEKMQDKIARTLYAYEHVHKPVKEARTTYCELLLILPILRTINMLFSSNISSLQETNESDMNPLILEVNSSASAVDSDA